MIRLTNCYDGFFRTNADCQKWAAGVVSEFREHFGENSIIKVGAYQSGPITNFTIDAFSLKLASRSLAITVMLTGSEIILPKQDLEQMDIYLPGLADTLFFAHQLVGESPVFISV